MYGSRLNESSTMKIEASLAFAALLLSSRSLLADVLIENVAIVTPERTKPLMSHHVLVRGERIVEISPRPIHAANARRIDGSERFLTPGLMDSHVHQGDAPGLPPLSDDPHHRKLRDSFLRQQPRSYLYFGVTQVLDPVSFARPIQTFEAQPHHPDVLRCGAAPALDGYPSLFVPPPVRYTFHPDYIFEPANTDKHPLPSGAKAEEHTPQAVVSRIAASGALCVKIFIESGFGGASDWPVLSEQTLAQIRAETRKHGLLLVAHANSLRAQRAALKADVDVIAHGLWNWDEERNKGEMPPAVAEHLRQVQRAQIGYQPTIRVMAGLADLFREDTLRDPNYKKVVPSDLREWYATDEGHWFKQELKANYGGASDTKIAHIHLQGAAAGMRAAKVLHGLGHPLLLGSDTPSSPTYGNQPGYDSYREMRFMAQAGIPLDAIFRAATINNARQFKIERDYGTVAVGKIANLLLLEANPLETVRAWSMIDKVVLRGEVLEREELVAR